MLLKWVKNSSGKPDAMLTFSVISVVVTAFCCFFSMLSKITIKGVEVDLVKPDTTLLLGFLSATLGAYVTRRNNILAKPDQFCTNCSDQHNSPLKPNG